MLSFTVFIAHRPCICPAPRPLPVRRSLRLLRLDRGPGRASPDLLTSLPLCVIPPNHWPFLFMRLRTLSFSWEGQFDAYPSLSSVRAESRSQPPLRLRLRELCVLCGLCVNSDSLLCAALPRATEHTSHCHP